MGIVKQNPTSLREKAPPQRRFHLLERAQQLVTFDERLSLIVSSDLWRGLTWLLPVAHLLYRRSQGFDLLF